MATFVIKTNLPEIPKCCGSCPASGTGVCRKWMNVDRKELGSKRADDCPILAVLPETHGRLIDGDEAKQRIDRNVADYAELANGGYYLAEDASEEVGLMETLVPAES